MFCFFIGCNLVTQPPPPPDNSIDPKSPSYRPPYVEIISSPKKGETVTGHTVTFKWRGNQEDTLMLFSYKLDNQNWSEWSRSKEVTYTYLDEGGAYIYGEGKIYKWIEQDKPTVVSFTVDAV